MGLNMDEYTLGQCPSCGKYGALKNGLCIDCEDKLQVPDFMKDLFDNFKDEKLRSKHAKRKTEKN